MKNHSCLRFIANLCRSRKALAIPMTFLILFASTLGLITVTYYLAVERVNAQSQDLQVTAAKQDFLSLDENIKAVVWQPGSARTQEISNSGGKLKLEPSAIPLAISISDGVEITGMVYNQSIGQVVYELPYTRSTDAGLYLKGDSRTITNQTGSVVTQLSVEAGAEYQEIQLRYRPTVSYATGGTDDDQTVNNIRVYVVNLNASDEVALHGKLPLRISCQSTLISTSTFSVAYTPGTLTLMSVLNSVSGEVTVPISSTVGGAVVHVQVVECFVEITRSLM